MKKLLLIFLIPFFSGCLEKEIIATPKNNSDSVRLAESKKEVTGLKKLIQNMTGELRDAYNNIEDKDVIPPVEYRDTCTGTGDYLVYVGAGAKVKFRKSDNLQFILVYKSRIDSLNAVIQRVNKEKTDIINKYKDGAKVTGSDCPPSGWSLKWLIIWFSIGLVIGLVAMFFIRLKIRPLQ